MGVARDPTTSCHPQHNVMGVAHPQHNGKVERMHCCLQRVRPLGRANWLAELSRVMFGLRAATNLDTGVSLSQMVAGQQPTLPGQLVFQRANIDNASVFGRELASAMAAQRFIENPWHGKAKLRTQVPQDLWTAKKVLVRVDKVQHSLEPKYTGPSRVVRRWGKCFRIQFEHKDDNVSVDRLRPFYEKETDINSQTGHVADTADNCGMTTGKKTNNKTELKCWVVALGPSEQCVNRTDWDSAL